MAPCKSQPNLNPHKTRRSVLIWGGSVVGGAAVTLAGWRLAEGRKHPVGAAVSPALGTSSAPAAGIEPLPMVEATLHHDVFAPLLHETFELGERAIECQLVEVSPPSVAKSFKGTFVTFSLLFEAPPRTLPDDGLLCEVSHRTAGRFEMFLSPVGKPARRQWLQAVCSAQAG